MVLITDITAVKRDYRVVGKLIGSFPGACRQNHVLTTPLYLTPEETTLLIEKGTLTPIYLNVLIFNTLQ